MTKTNFFKPTLVGELTKEENEMVADFIKDYKSYLWFWIKWRYFDGECCFRGAGKLVDTLKEKIDEIDKKWEVFRVSQPAFLSVFFHLTNDESKQLLDIVEFDLQKFFKSYFTHEFECDEEGAVKEFLTNFEKKVWDFFSKIKNKK